MGILDDAARVVGEAERNNALAAKTEWMSKISDMLSQGPNYHFVFIVAHAGDDGVEVQELTNTGAAAALWMLNVTAQATMGREQEDDHETA